MDIRDLDFDRIVKRFDLTLARKNHDRPLLYISYPSGKKAARPPAPPTARDRWLSYDWRLDSYEADLVETGYFAEGFPAYFANLGPDVLTGFTGSDLDFSRDGTTWAKPRVADWAQEPPLRFEKEVWLWKETAKFLELTAIRGKGRWLTASGDLHSNGDALSALRGPQELLMDLIDCPDEIKKRLAEIFEVFKQVLDEHFRIVHPHSNGMITSWLTAACRGRYATIQNDFSCMVGPEMFDEFFKEYVEKEAALLDYSIYHLDGPGAAKHAESICASTRLNAVQWVPGDGNKPCVEWSALLHKIQSLGKGLWLYGTPAEVERMAGYLKPEGCMYDVRCSSRDEAERLLKSVERICAGKK